MSKALLKGSGLGSGLKIKYRTRVVTPTRPLRMEQPGGRYCITRRELIGGKFFGNTVRNLRNRYLKFET